MNRAQLSPARAGSERCGDFHDSWTAQLDGGCGLRAGSGRRQCRRRNRLWRARARRPAAAHRARARWRRRARHRPHQRDQGHREGRHPGRLRGRHQHGLAGRRVLCRRHAGRGDRGAGAVAGLGAHVQRFAGPGRALVPAQGGGPHQLGLAWRRRQPRGTCGRHRRAGRPADPAAVRAPDPAGQHHRALRRPADSLSRDRDRPQYRRGGDPRSRQSCAGDARAACPCPESSTRR